VRTFQDEDGQRWVASVGFRPGRDYQGRYFFVVRREEEAAGDPADGLGEGGELSLPEIRWNSEKTARRTLETMSEVELRRRLRSARGRLAVRRPT
jgi:hypothetical protein